LNVKPSPLLIAESLTSSTNLSGPKIRDAKGDPRGLGYKEKSSREPQCLGRTKGVESKKGVYEVTKPSEKKSCLVKKRPFVELVVNKKAS